MPLTTIDPAKRQLLDAILTEVPFEGWSPKAFDAAVSATGMNPSHARTLCPRGAVDLAIAFHHLGDSAMVEAIRAADLRDKKYRDKVAFAIRARLDAITDKESVRRATALFALPHLAADGARLIWGTADLIWDTLGDTSTDVNWYTKRATLSGVYAAVVLYWLGDQSTGAEATDSFIARRIDNVMQIEKLKADVNANRALKPLTDPLNRLMGMIKAPTRIPPVDLPGSWTAPR
jgi:ubiquinone biosynthesis protein COQ9